MSTIFPDKIAERAISRLTAVINQEPSINGCAEDLRASMKKAGIARFEADSVGYNFYN